MRETAYFAGTQTQILIDEVDTVYAGIERAQAVWKNVAPFHCPDGCGSCCIGFEPDVLESEALYLAAWMLYHQRQRAEAILEGRFISLRHDPGDGCFLYDPKNPHHCTVYGGRCLICRLFGYAGDRGKTGRLRWKPCRFLPLEASAGGAVCRKQYDETELLDLFGALPPLMADITSQLLALTPDSQEPVPLRDALPQAIGKLKLLERYSGLHLVCSEYDRGKPDPDAPAPDPENPLPRAS